MGKKIFAVLGLMVLGALIVLATLIIAGRLENPLKTREFSAPGPSVSLSSARRSPAALLKAYLLALKAGNVSDALALWDPDTLRKDEGIKESIEERCAQKLFGPNSEEAREFAKKINLPWNGVLLNTRVWEESRPIERWAIELDRPRVKDGILKKQEVIVEVIRRTDGYYIVDID